MGAPLLILLRQVYDRSKVVRIQLSMTAKQLAGSRERLSSFLAEMLTPLGRKDRQHWGGVYLRGLLLGPVNTNSVISDIVNQWRSQKRNIGELSRFFRVNVAT